MSRSVLGAEAAISGKLTGWRFRRMSDLASTSSRRNGVSVVGAVAAAGSPSGSTDVGMRLLFASGLTSVAEAVGSAVTTACLRITTASRRLLLPADPACPAPAEPPAPHERVRPPPRPCSTPPPGFQRRRQRSFLQRLQPTRLPPRRRQQP